MGGVVELVCPVFGLGKALNGVVGGLRSLLVVQDNIEMDKGCCVRCVCDCYSAACLVIKCEDCCNLGYVLVKMK